MASPHWDYWAGSSERAFPWHDESLRELFEQVSEAGVGRVQELVEKRQAE